MNEKQTEATQKMEEMRGTPPESRIAVEMGSPGLRYAPAGVNQRATPDGVGRGGRHGEVWQAVEWVVTA